jgi:hypothetical protein
MEEIRIVEKTNMGIKEKRSYIENLTYEKKCRVWDSHTRKETTAFYFGYSTEKEMELFLSRNGRLIRIYGINEDLCWVRNVDEVGIPCFDTRRIHPSRHFWGCKEERDYALKRLLELQTK